MKEKRREEENAEKRQSNFKNFFIGTLDRQQIEGRHLFFFSVAYLKAMEGISFDCFRVMNHVDRG